MTAPVFFAPRVQFEAADELWLEGPEGHHAATVRRVAVAEQVLVTDGAGRSADCTVLETGRDRVRLRVTARHVEPEPAPRLVVVQALAKGDRGEVAVQTLTEAGVDLIVPWAAARSVTRWRDERGAKALTRWRSTAHEAAKQSRRTRFSEVSDVVATPDVAAWLASAALRVVLHETGERSLADANVPTAGDIVLVVGPEGGIDPDELAAFAAVGAASYRMGPTVLRTSTAGTLAAGVLLARTSRWSGAARGRSADG